MIGQALASAELGRRSDVVRELYGMGFLDSSGRDNALGSLNERRSSLSNDFISSSLIGAGKVPSILGALLLSESAEAGVKTRSGSWQRGVVDMINGYKFDDLAASLNLSMVMTTLGRYASVGGSIDAVKKAGFAAEALAFAKAESLGLTTFKVQRSNGTGFDLITAKVNNGIVSDVMILDVKNTIGEIPSITAFGPGAKNPAANFAGNLSSAVEKLSGGVYKGNDIAEQIANAIKRQNYGMAIVTTEHATVGANVASQALRVTGKPLGPPLRWLP
jgi:hypothetical protein